MKKEFFVIDMHSHVADSNTPARIAERAGAKDGVRKAFEGLQRLQRDVGYTDGMIALNPSPDNFMRYMDISGTDVAILSMLGFTEELDGIEISSSDYLAGVINDEKYAGRFYGFAGVDPRLPDAAQRIENYITQQGFIGAKLNPNDWGTFPLNSPLLEPIFAKCQELEVPLHIHTGTDPSGVIANGDPLLLDKVAARYPRLVILLEHYGFPFKYQAYAMCNKHENVYLTLAWHFNKLVHHNHLLAWQELEEMRIYAGIDKILYGSDFPATPNNKEVLDFLKNARLPLILRRSGVKEWDWEMRAKVLGLNAAKILKINHPKLAAIKADIREEPSFGRGEAITMEWSEDAQAMLAKIPPFIRGQAIRKIESYAKDHEAAVVTVEIMNAARKA